MHATPNVRLNLLLCLFCLGCSYEGGIHFDVTARQNAFLISVTGETDTGEELLEKWYQKARELCSNKRFIIEPNGKPVVRNSGCGDAVTLAKGFQSCEVIKASVFGKITCVTK
ncbi:hypothetical protein N480_05720 [Pseudoalteromonas luteoviolacea S2607]|uniref:hypothetical protein n=1 Tax=Pseudoalteromonas luteoviolacea TaxID=43657 RepID=UPI0007B04782|nr:hypothetical protein [Pseudoalteromonas luteoviolacea]KZN30451.1 hypothetical protein N480_05720 [Pseudoalteromonas luteoviolacea S2607]